MSQSPTSRSAVANSNKNDGGGVIVGGPGSRLPKRLESALGWTLCFSCLTVSGYHECKSNFFPLLYHTWYRGVMVFWFNTFMKHCLKLFANTSSLSFFDWYKKLDVEARGGWGSEFPYETFPYVPLVTASRQEVKSKSPKQRHDQLVSLLDCIATSTLSKAGWNNMSDADLVHLLREDQMCRRLASLMMRPYDSSSGHRAGSSFWKRKGTTTLLLESPELELPKRLAVLWPRLLALPRSLGKVDLRPASTSRKGENESGYGKQTTSSAQSAVIPRFCFRITLIVPAFCEDGKALSEKLYHAKLSCLDPDKVEVLVIDAGGCTHLNDETLWGHNDRMEARLSQWGATLIMTFTGGGGRGPCLNFGAERARGRILTFLHADTVLPKSWDNKISEALALTEEDDDDYDIDQMLQMQDEKKKTTPQRRRRPNACAFSFGIDTSIYKLRLCTKEGEIIYYPPGIRAVEITANLRTQMFSLPYGDQVLSIPNLIFRHLGGFPDQCLMEDYELVRLLRRRAFWMPKFSSVTRAFEEHEYLHIIGPPAALCSPRRWQKFGVLHVTFLNSKLVNLYAGGMGPDDLFRKYYHLEPARRESGLQSPWEVDLDCRMKNEE